MSSPIEDLLGGLLGGSGQGGVGNLLGGAGGAGALGALVPVVTGMLAGGGLNKLMSNLSAAGLDDKAKSWVSSGANKPMSADEVKQVVDPGNIDEIAQKAGVSKDEAAGLIAQALPAVVDHLTPDGHLPDAAALDQTLSKATGAGPAGA
jgi:uncharacterized protein YidB (DUF937 family)